jgi:hypothetical protein
MKKVLAVAVVLCVLFLSSCKKEPITNYSVGSIIKPEDWSGPYVSLRKTILVKDILSSYLNSKDSLKLVVSVGDLSEFKNMPNPKVLDASIHTFLFDCKYKCKNTATFKPYSLDIYNVKEILPHEPTKKEYSDFEEQYGQYKEFKHMYGYYTFNKERMIANARRGTPKHILLSLEFLASNAYGTPGELRGYATIENGVYKFNGASD